VNKSLSANLHRDYLSTVTGFSLVFKICHRYHNGQLLHLFKQWSGMNFVASTKKG